jgi:hypothetical protein
MVNVELIFCDAKVVDVAHLLGFQYEVDVYTHN